jgi:hypothetical protein
MKQASTWLIFLLALALVAMSVTRSCTQANDGLNKAKYDSLITAISVKMDSVNARKEIMQTSSDTVIYRSNKVKEIVREYYTIHDTISRLIYCDSLAEECEELAYDCAINDSLHRKQEVDLGAVISKQDTLIKVLSQSKRRRVFIPIPFPIIIKR